MVKNFKSAGLAGSRRPEEILQAAAPMLDRLPAATPQAPPPPVTKAEAAATDDEEVVQINFRVRRSLADALADAADERRTTQKVIICDALRAAGFTVHPDDLEDRSGRRRRGTKR